MLAPTEYEGPGTGGGGWFGGLVCGGGAGEREMLMLWVDVSALERVSPFGLLLLGAVVVSDSRACVLS